MLRAGVADCAEEPADAESVTDAHDAKLCAAIAAEHNVDIGLGRYAASGSRLRDTG